jgi:flagellar hook protein FlgE
LNTTPLALGTTTFTDDLPDTAIEINPTIDRMGVKAGNGTRLINVLIRDGDTYSRPFEQMGELSFEGRRGDRTLGAKVLQIDASTTVQDLIVFMEDSFGLTNEDIDYANLPYTLPEADGTIGTDGVIRFTSNAGITNALGVTQSSFELTPNGVETPIPIDLPFTETQPAHGEGSLTDFVVYDSLGTALDVRVSTVLEEKGDTFTRYRWFATSDDNEPADGLSTFVGTGTIVFDERGNIQSGGTGDINIQRNQSAAASPLTVELDFSRVSGRGSDASMRMTGQDGFAPGTLSSFIITESGLIRGIFSNGAERPLGQIRMARFPNNVGLQQIGENLFASGINSGTAQIDDPGANGIGTLTSGALELSNTDIGQNLIELILASTQYRGGARVITTAQQLLDELLNLRR